MKLFIAMALVCVTLSTTSARAAESPESALEFVRALYNGLLLRGDGGDSDPGRQDWINALVGGASRGDVENAIRGSDEYAQKHQTANNPVNNPPPANPPANDPPPSNGGDNTAFVRSLYVDLLLRPDGGDSDPGRQNWVDALNRGSSRADVRNAIMGSDEYKQKHTTAGNPPPNNPPVTNGNLEFVRGLYRDLLKRADGGDSDPGRQAWIDALNSGQSRAAVQKAIMDSGEFQDKNPAYGTQNAGVFNTKAELQAFLSENYLRIIGRPIAEFLGVFTNDFLTGRMTKDGFLAFFKQIADSESVLKPPVADNPVDPNDPQDPPPGPTREQIVAQATACIKKIYTEELLRADGGDSDPGRQPWINDVANGKKSCAQAKAEIQRSSEYVAKHPATPVDPNEPFDPDNPPAITPQQLLAQATACVRQIYKDELGRADGGDSDPGRQSWVDSVFYGKQTCQSARNGIRNSAEAIAFRGRQDQDRLNANAQFIKDQAQVILGRTLTQAEFDNQPFRELFRRLNDGTFSRDFVIAQLRAIGADEQRLAQNAQFVKDEAKSILGRTLTQAEFDSDKFRVLFQGLNDGSYSRGDVIAWLYAIDAQEKRDQADATRLAGNAQFVIDQGTLLLGRPIGRADIDNQGPIRELFRRLNDGTLNRDGVILALRSQAADEQRLAQNADFIRAQAQAILGHALSQSQFDYLFRRLNDFSLTRPGVISQINGIKIAENTTPTYANDG
jgi:hypothetical protein